MLFPLNRDMLSLLLEKKTRCLEPTPSVDQWLKEGDKKIQKNIPKSRPDRGGNGMTVLHMQHLDVFNVVVVMDFKIYNI